METNKKETVLIIDNDENVVKNLSQELSNKGFNVITAFDSNSAVKKLSDNPDVVLIELGLGLQKEVDIINRVKIHSSTKDIPVIALSNKNENMVYDKLEQFNDFILKPLSLHEVYTRINNQLNIQKIKKDLEEKNKQLKEKNVILEQLATTDELTGLFNRRYIIDRLKSELKRSIRYGEPISCLMIDVDYFKKINDSFGHLVGDTLLVEVAKLIKSSARSADIVGRYGGEEFIIISPQTDNAGASILSERIRQTISDMMFDTNERMITVTLSIGIRCLKPTLNFNSKIDFDIDSEAIKMISDADIALYRAKNNGRNRIEIYKEINTDIINNENNNSTLLYS